MSRTPVIDQLRQATAPDHARLEARLDSTGNPTFSPDELAEIDRFATDGGINIWKLSSTS